jgi:uncharacterized protein YabN with tetrapyrrole methylase and pyrophosphatase domain
MLLPISAGSPSAPTIGIIGAGILSPDHLTLESDRFLQQSSVIFHLLESGEAMTAYLRSLGPRLVDLSEIYTDGVLDYDIYRQIADRLIAAAFEYTTVALLVPGHPLVMVAPTALILQQAARAGVNVTVLPGISSLDTMILQLNLEIGTNGVQIFEANRFIYYDIRPDPRVPLFLFQPGSIGSGIITRNARSLSARFEPLKHALLKTYPADHECMLLASQTLSETGGSTHSLQIQNLPSAAHAIDYDTSLFVPPSKPFQIANTDFYYRLNSQQYASTLLDTVDNDQ